MVLAIIIRAYNYLNFNSICSDCRPLIICPAICFNSKSFTMLSFIIDSTLHSSQTSSIQSFIFNRPLIFFYALPQH